MIKAMGENSEIFEKTVISIIKKHVTDLKEDAIQSRLSENGKYSSISITIQAQSKEQLDAIYRELTGSPLVLMVL